MGHNSRREAGGQLDGRSRNLLIMAMKLGPNDPLLLLLPMLPLLLLLPWWHMVPFRLRLQLEQLHPQQQVLPRQGWFRACRGSGSVRPELIEIDERLDVAIEVLAHVCGQVIGVCVCTTCHVSASLASNFMKNLKQQKSQIKLNKTIKKASVDIDLDDSLEHLQNFVDTAFNDAKLNSDKK